MYSVRVLRLALKDIAKLPKEYARLVSQHIDELANNPRPADAKKLCGQGNYRLREEYTVCYMPLMMRLRR
jgi:mRNA-degrading endonuclease RelE of RelBE toxin-antitoxin system